MALFKILKGDSSTFSTNLTASNVTPSFNEGYCYFLQDTNMFYVDWLNGSTQCRTALNANNAKTLLDKTWEDFEAEIKAFMADHYASSDSIPTKTSDLTNNSGYITSAQAPVQSFNGRTGAVKPQKGDYTPEMVGAVSKSGDTISGDLTVTGTITGDTVNGAVWNDYAEYRSAESLEPGRCVIEGPNGRLLLSTERLQPGANVISDTFGFSIGETGQCKTPIAVAGRVLAYTFEDRNEYPLGAAVCSGPNGMVSLMSREEIKEYPERIVGTVSEIPEYTVWGSGNIKVNGRIWIKVR